MKRSIIVHTEDESRIFERRVMVPPVVTGQHDFRVVIIRPDYDQVYDDLKDEGKPYTHLSRTTFLFQNRMDGKDRIATPAMWSQVLPNGLSDFTPMHERLERWIFDLCWKSSGLSLAEAKKNWFTMLTGGTPEQPMAARGLTDNAGSDSMRSFVLGTNEDKGPMKIKLAGCSGMALHAIGETKLAGSECHIAEAIDPNDPDFERFHPSTHPWLFFRPAVSGNLRIVDAKGYYAGKEQRLAEPWWQFAYKAWVPILGYGGKAYFPKRICRELASTEPIPSPFWNSTHPQHKLISPFYPNPYPAYAVQPK